MKLRNKKTGEIGTPECSLGLFNVQIIRPDEISNFSYDSLAELNEEWEDYEEPEEYWYIGYKNIVRAAEKKFRSDYADNDITEKRREIGNYFETREEAEKAVEKLKAWKRLKDKGFDKVFNLEFSDALCGGKTVEFKLLIDDEALIEDIKLLFGGEE